MAHDNTPPQVNDTSRDRPPALGHWLLCLALLCALGACTRQDHLDLESPWFALDDDQLALQVTWSGWQRQQQRRTTERTIGVKALDMIASARSVIVLSVFLFDNFYSEEPAPWDVVEAFTAAIIAQKQRYPDLVVALVLDPSNRAYSNRVAPAVARLSAAGADVFYSDLLATRAHTPLKVVEAMHHGGRVLSQASNGWLGEKFKMALTAIRIPCVDAFDQHPANVQMVLNAALIKANHRKILVTDHDDGYEALISSANPHNASVNSTNFGVSVTGDLARYIYNAQRLDIAHSLSLGGPDYVLWHPEADQDYRQRYLDAVLKALPVATPRQLDGASDGAQIRAKFITEQRVKRHLLSILRQVQVDDELRIQMFYLSDLDVIDALMHAATITRPPIKLLLDPNKDAFGREKDGTPNRQVAALLTGHLDNAELSRLQRHFPDFIRDGQLAPLNLELRWFDTHGEQNHAKIMSVTNAAQDKYILLQGSANWTGKNLSGTNMEANILIEGAASLVGEFNQLFDRFFTNTPELRFSVPYQHPEYREHSGIGSWLNGENYGFVSW